MQEVLINSQKEITAGRATLPAAVIHNNIKRLSLYTKDVHQIIQQYSF